MIVCSFEICFKYNGTNEREHNSNTCCFGRHIILSMMALCNRKF
jgi:hypothetical protein